MKKNKWRELFDYKFDNFMAKGGSSIFLSLVVVFAICLVVIVVFRGTFYFLLPEASSQHGRDFFTNFYITFLQMTDPGNMAQDITSSPLFKIFSVLSGLLGIVMLSTLIAFVTTALDRKLSQLKKGHSKVIEEDHTLILGWNEQRVIEIIRELIIANESEDDACVVILAEKDKEEMDDFLNLHLPDTQNTRVVTRSGSISSLANLEIVALEACKAVIVLASCHESALEFEKSLSDARVIKTILALMTARQKDVRFNIVAEAFLQHNRHVLENLSPTEITTLDTQDILSKILVQTSRSIGLSVVYNEILSFDGCEMYFHHADWQGLTFGELPYHFADGVPMGIRRQDGTLLVNPNTNEKLQNTDDILILADDDSTIHFQKEAIARAKDYTGTDLRKAQTVEKELLLGWTAKSETIINEYADYVLEGSQINVMLVEASPEIQNKIKEINEKTPHLNIQWIEGNPLKTKDLLAIRPFEYDNIIILSQNGDDRDVEKSDAETIILLLLLRDIFHKHPEESQNTKLITEVLDSENQELIANVGVNDFIISNRLISMLFAQISESQDIKKVYDDLFEEDGSEIYLKPAHHYFENLPCDLTYADMIRAAQKRGEVCLGVKTKSLEMNKAQNYGVKLIPDKNKTHTLSPQDSLVVLAEDET
jgi:K+/H+ antiporter YhaU regulatory subunit KhtT